MTAIVVPAVASAIVIPNPARYVAAGTHVPAVALTLSKLMVVVPACALMEPAKRKATAEAKIPRTRNRRTHRIASPRLGREGVRAPPAELFWKAQKYLFEFARVNSKSGGSRTFAAAA